MKRILIAAAVLGSLTACGAKATAPEAEIVPLSQIDLSKWTAEVVAQSGIRADPNMQLLYSATTSMCTDSVSTLAIALTLTGATPDLDRIDMQYVCPTDAHKVDDALTSVQSSMKVYTDACAVDPTLRTQAQKDMVDGVGPCPPTP